jgi:MFS family permease
MVLGPALGATASKLGVEAPPLVAAALAALDLLAALVLMPETHPPGSPVAPAAARKDPFVLRALLRDPRIAVVLGLYFLTFLYMTTLQVALPLLANARLGWAAQEIGRVFALFGLMGMVVQGLLIGRMTKTFGASNLVMAGAVSSFTGLLLIAAAHSALVLVGGLSLLGLGLGITNPILSALASEYAGPSRQGLVLGFAQSAGGLARTVGPVGSGFLYAQLGPGAAFVGGAMSALAALLLAIGVRVAGFKEESAPSSA